jgi:hypothetical protein
VPALPGPSGESPAGLCWPCYYRPGLRDLYPSGSRHARRGIGNYIGTRPPAPEPTTARPGTPEKLDVLHERAKAGYQLFHEADPRT